MNIRKHIEHLIQNGDYERAMWELCNIIEHDVACWRSIALRADSSEVIRVTAQQRVECLAGDVDAFYEAIQKAKDSASGEGG